MTFEKFKMLRRRAWKLTGKTYFFGLIAVMLIAGFFLLLRLSMTKGNLAPIFDDSAIITEMSKFLYYTTVGLVSTAVAGGAGSTLPIMLLDIKSGWLRYSFTLPVSPKLRAWSSVLFTQERLLIGSAVAILNGILCAKVFDVPFSVHTVLLILALEGAYIIYDFTSCLFGTKARTEKGISTANFKAILLYMAVIMGAIFLGKGGSLSGVSPDETMDVRIEKLRNAFYTHETAVLIFVIVTFVIFPIINYFVSARNLRMYGDVNENQENGVLFRLGGKKGGAAS